MRCLWNPSVGLAYLAAVSSLAAATHLKAEPLEFRHEPVKIHHKRQASGAAATTAIPTTTQTFEPPLAATGLSVGSKVSAIAPLSSVDTPSRTTSGGTDTPTGCTSKVGQIQVSVSQPTLCSTSALQYSSKIPLATGVVIIQCETGWGDVGSIWNISTNNGVELKDLKVPCQGSACTGITGNTEVDGSITQNPDGSWSMNVTSGMQPSVHITGNATGGDLVDCKYDLSITSTPPCALPVYQNCSSRTFNPSADQWNAYSAGDFLTKYLSDNNLNSLEKLFSKASTDFLPTTDAQSYICNPDAGTTYECQFPSHTLCDSTKPDAVAGYLVVASVIRMSNLLQLLYQSIDSAQGDMAGYITQIVVKFFQPQAEQEWTSIVTAVSSIVGLFTFIAILIDGFTAGSATPAIVAAVVGIQSALAAAANFKNGFEKQKPDATYLAIDGNYTQSVMDYARGLEETVDNVWNNTELGASGIAEALGSGEWLQVPNPFNVTGIFEEARDWLDNLLVTSYINRVFQDADAFIVFIAYGEVGNYKYTGKDHPKTRQFTKEECNDHWANDPSWPYYATCDVSLGSGGPDGMAVVTRPSSEGKGSKEWTTKVEWQWASYKWDAHAFMESAVYGYGDHGFNYNLTSLDFSSILNKGSQAAIDQWKTLPLSTPGLFNIPVCQIYDLAYVPGGGQVQADMESTRYGAHYNDPCTCVTANYSGAMRKQQSGTEFARTKEAQAAIMRAKQEANAKKAGEGPSSGGEKEKKK
ncbi:hypothetical protein Q9189_006661 [Teloschistes chrysophthalmus]